MCDVKKRIVMLIVETLLLSIEITFLFSTNFHRALNIRNDVGGYIKEVKISQKTVSFEYSHDSSGENLKTLYLEEGTIVCFENSNGLALLGFYVDNEGGKHDILVDLSQVELSPEIQLYLSELNEVNKSRKDEFVRIAMIYDFPISFFISLVISLVVSVIAKDMKKHVICLIVGMLIILVVYFIARNINVPI